MSTHSPLPWRVELRAENGVTYIRPANDDEYWSDAMPMFLEGRNAEFIVRACNAHEEMLSELKHLVSLLEPAMNHGRVQVPGLATLNRAHLVIAKAEGK